MPIPDHFYPFYRVFDERGQQYCDCSHEEYAIRNCGVTCRVSK